jgi:hypothetical protein
MWRGEPSGFTAFAGIFEGVLEKPSRGRGLFVVNNVVDCVVKLVT